MFSLCLCGFSTGFSKDMQVCFNYSIVTLYLPVAEILRREWLFVSLCLSCDRPDSPLLLLHLYLDLMHLPLLQKSFLLESK